MSWVTHRASGLMVPLLLMVIACSPALAFVGTGTASASVPLVAQKGPLPKTGGRVIVKYRLGESLSGARMAASEMGAAVVGRVRTFGLRTTGRCLVVSSSSLDTAELVKQYRADPAVDYVEPDYVIRADGAVTPNDPLAASLWGLTRIGAPLAWSVTTGQADVVVADIDSGVDYTHPDLAANMWHNPERSSTTASTTMATATSTTCTASTPPTGARIPGIQTATARTPPGRWPQAATTASASPASAGRPGSWRSSSWTVTARGTPPTRSPASTT